MATPVCPPWAPDVWALVAGMYWLYGCWKIHNHKHTLHCCTLRTPTLMLFLHGPPPKISIYCRDLFDFLRTCACVDGCGKTEASNRDVLSFLLPPHVSFYLFLPTKLQYCPLLRCTVNLSYEQLLSDRRGPFLISRSDTQSIFMIWDVFRRSRLLLLSLHKSHTSFSMSPKYQQIPQVCHRKLCLRRKRSYFFFFNFISKIRSLRWSFQRCVLRALVEWECGEWICKMYASASLYIYIRCFIVFYWIITSPSNLFAWKRQHSFPVLYL